jgi:hypothetical protein
MPLVYADEDMAKAVIGSPWHAPYIEAMGCCGIGDFMYSQPSPQVGQNLFERLGMKSPLSKYESKGMKPAEVFRRFRAIHAQAKQRIAGIPRGSAKEKLEKMSSKLEPLAAQLAQAFAPGAKMGTKDRGRLENYVAGVKDLRSAVNAQVKIWGLRPVPDEESPEVEEVAKASAAAPAEKGGFNPLLLLVPAALLFLR